jgi:hypothetical protein
MSRRLSGGKLAALLVCLAACKQVDVRDNLGSSTNPGGDASFGSGAEDAPPPVPVPDAPPPDEEPPDAGDPAVWTTPTRLDNGGFNTAPRMAIDSAGNAVAVWMQSSSLVVARYDKSSATWATPEPITGGGQVSAFDWGMFPDGGILVAWTQDDQPNEGIWVRRSAPSGWQAPSRLMGGSAVSPRVAISASGSAIVVFSVFAGEPVTMVLHASSMSPAGAFGTLETIGGPSGNDTLASIGMDEQGRGIALWERFDSMGASSIMACRYTSGSWGMPWVVNENSSVMVGASHLAMNAKGVAALNWAEYRDDAWWFMWQIVDASGLRGPIAAIPDLADFPEPGVIDEMGNAMIGWSAFDAARRYQARARRYAQGQWEETRRLESDNAADEDHPDPMPGLHIRLAMNPSGSAFVVWRKKRNGVNGIWARPYVPGFGWRPATPIETRAEEASEPTIALSSSGVAGAVWIYGQNTVWASFSTAGAGEVGDGGRPVR